MNALPGEWQALTAGGAQPAGGRARAGLPHRAE